MLVIVARTSPKPSFDSMIRPPREQEDNEKEDVPLYVLSTTLLSVEADVTEDFSASHDKIIECITSCIHVARLSDILEQQQNLVHVFLISLSPGFPWTVKMSVFSSIKELCSRLQNNAHDYQDTSIHAGMTLVQELFSSVSPKVLECLSMVKIAQVHIAASECLMEVTNLYGLLPMVDGTEVGFKEELLKQYEVEKNEQAKSLLKKCIDILTNLEQKAIQTS
ncbi:unnamed protein product [Ilex paraguariensis]|uniref:HEAT repeat-containing protein 1 n=1 Tax=Ilex paraguariensis TaxID=185542 RepID=A0ABC8RRM6_9AQUA